MYALIAIHTSRPSIILRVYDNVDAIVDDYVENEGEIVIEDIPYELRMVKAASKLQLQRKRRGLSQRQLSEVTDIPLPTLRALEQGRRKIDSVKVERIFRLIGALDCKIEDIL